MNKNNYKIKKYIDNLLITINNQQEVWDLFLNKIVKNSLKNNNLT